MNRIYKLIKKYIYILKTIPSAVFSMHVEAILVVGWKCLSVLLNRSDGLLSQQKIFFVNIINVFFWWFYNLIF